MAWQRGNIAYSSELLPDWRDAVGRSLRKHNKQTDVPSTPPGLEGNWPHPGMKREELAFLGWRSSRKGDRHDSDWRKLPLRRRKIRNHRAAIKPAELPLFAMSQATWRAVPQPRSGAGRRLPVAAGRAPDQILRERGRLPARVLPRMRLSDHQPDGTELEARRPVPPRIVSMRHPVGHSRRSTGPAGMPRLRRQQGAVVRDHRRSAAICGIRAAGLKPRQIGMRQAAGMDMQPAEFGAAV